MQPVFTCPVSNKFTQRVYSSVVRKAPITSKVCNVQEHGRHTYVEDSDHDLEELRAEEMDKDEDLWTLYLALKQKMKIDPKETGYVPFYAFLDFMTKEMVDQDTADQDSS